MGTIITIIFVGGIIYLAVFLLQQIDLSKIKPIVESGVENDLSQNAICLLIVRNLTRSRGRVLTDSEVGKIKVNIKKIILKMNRNIPLNKEDDVKNIFTYLSNGNLPFLTQKDEKIITIIPGVGLKEPRSIRVSRGGYGGTSFRVAKGISVHTGRFGSTSSSHEEVKDIDGGDLVVTNQRLFFTGSKRTANIAYKKIVSIEPYSNAIVVHKDGRERAQYFLWPIGLLSLLNEQSHQIEPLTGSLLQATIQGQINS